MIQSLLNTLLNEQKIPELIPSLETSFLIISSGNYRSNETSRLVILVFQNTKLSLIIKLYKSNNSKIYNEYEQQKSFYDIFPNLIAKPLLCEEINGFNILIEKPGSLYKQDLIDLGETACVALAKILNKNSIPNLLVIDERTTRMLCEKPDNLRKLLTKKHHTTIKYDKNSLAEFTGFKIIRSAELAFLAHKKGIVKIKDKKVLDALIYALKFKGCSISTEEIEELKRMK